MGCREAEAESLEMGEGGVRAAREAGGVGETRGECARDRALAAAGGAPRRAQPLLGGRARDAFTEC